MAIIVGIDPGTTCTGIAVTEGATVLDVRAMRIKSSSSSEWIRNAVAPMELLMCDWGSAALVVVEGQQVRHGSKAPPADIIKLANIAGALAGMVASMSTCMITIPKPEDWKGQTPKPIDQARSYDFFGWGYTKLASYAYPSGCKVAASTHGYGRLKQSDWKEVGDALGLARYGLRLLA